MVVVVGCCYYFYYYYYHYYRWNNKYKEREQDEIHPISKPDIRLWSWLGPIHDEK